MRIAWATDVHLNFLEHEARQTFGRELVLSNPDAVILSGDITEASALEGHLDELAEALARPLYFVLGNHDFYHGSVGVVRSAMRELSSRSPHLHWLPAMGVVPLGDNVCLVGVDGWGDGRSGNPEGTAVNLNDFVLIRELAGLSREALLGTVRALGDAEATLAARLLDEALSGFEHVLFVTHVPPFVEACWHEGRVSGVDWQPWFTCHAVGEVLRGRLSREPGRTATVLCGHTHSPGSATILPNLQVYTGGADYGAPCVAGHVEVGPQGIRVVLV